MNVKLLLDEDVHASLAEALRQRGYDAVHLQELDRKGSSDAEQLAYATAQERCFVSFNVKDFVLLHNLYVTEEKEHWGVRNSVLSERCYAAFWPFYSRSPVKT